MITNYINDGIIYPAVGISFGLSSIFELLKEKEDIKTYNDYLYIIPMNTEKESLDIANKLRNKGIKVIIEMNKRKIKKCFEWADKNNIPYALVIGEDEINNNIINIKNMKTGNSITYQIEEIDRIVDDIK